MHSCWQRSCACVLGCAMTSPRCSYAAWQRSISGPRKSSSPSFWGSVPEAKRSSPNWRMCSQSWPRICRTQSAGQGLRANRERALLCVAYETLARRGELVALQIRDIDFHPDGTGQALIRRGKTDAEGQGRAAYLSRETVRWLKVWLEHAEIEEGKVFRRLIGRTQVGGLLNPGSIAPIFKRVAQWIGMPARFVAQVSGHSTRVGATQDLAALDIDLAAITQAGGWKSTRMPLQYAEKINAARSGMARAAAASFFDQTATTEKVATPHLQ